jgi:tetratricopeptide (TPR) repeat protein
MAKSALSFGLVLLLGGGGAGATHAAAGDSTNAVTAARRFEWTTKSAAAKERLREVQARIERFEFGPATAEAARTVVAADPEFAMGVYYLSAVTTPPENEKHLARAVELSQKASDGERRFIEAMNVARANQGASANLQQALPLLEKLAADYPGERLVPVILGQLYQAQSQPEKARAAFERAQVIGPSSLRIRSFLANDDILNGRYEQARQAFLSIEKELPKDSAPFAVRYGLAFTYLYQGEVDPALEALKTYVGEYKDSGAAQGFPEVFIWNSIARINLENGRLEAAMKAYETGYASVPGSSLPEDQKQLWRGRLQHGRCRTLAKMGRHQEAWAEAQTLKKMIDDGGEAAKQYLPAWHYLAGYLKLEAADYPAAIAELKQANPDDPFHQLLLARAYEKAGAKDDAQKAYRTVVDSRQNGLERALAYPEAKKKLASS